MKNDLRLPNYLEILDSLPEKAEQIHKAMEQHGPCTALELSAKINWLVTSVRPRICDLKNKYGLIETTGERRNGEHVFRFVSIEEAQRRARIADQIEFDTAQSFRLTNE